MAFVGILITFGKINFTIELDENLIQANTWKKLAGPAQSCPSSGEWEKSSDGSVFMNDSSRNPAMTLQQFRNVGVGDTGTGFFEASGFLIPRHRAFDWRITEIDKEWWG